MSTNITNVPAGDHITKFQQQMDASTQRGALGPSVDPEAEAESVRDVDAADIVRQVEDKIASVQARLQETRGFDPKTGAKRYAIDDGDMRRKALEVELHHLQTSVLPYTRTRAAEIVAMQATLESPAQRLQAEANRQQRVAVAAQKRAEELEVDAMAQRLLSARKHVGSA